jgi:hypothetical protein
MSKKQDRSKPPNADDLMKLSRWARVAFAARCARRVQPLFTHFWPGAPKEHVEAIDRAITLSEASARVGRAEASLSTAAAAADTAALAALAALAAVRASASAALAAASAALAADADAAATTAADAAAATAADDAAAAARAASLAAAEVYVAAAWADYESLRAILSNRKKKLFATLLDRDRAISVDVANLGPLWPLGEPQGWPQSTDRKATGRDTEESSTLDTLSPPVFLIAWDPHVVSDEDYAAIVTALGNLVRAEGGLGIQRVRSQAVPVNSNVGAGVLS